MYVKHQRLIPRLSGSVTNFQEGEQLGNGAARGIVPI